MGPSDSLIGHLSGRFATQPENLATEALYWVLDRHGAAAAAFERHARQWNPRLGPAHPFRTQGSVADDAAIPDLVGGDASGGGEPLLVEVKFWAPLTKYQPVQYLKRLPGDGTGLLLFLCPEARRDHLWRELLDRCEDDDEGGRLKVSERDDARCSAMVDGRALGVTTWKEVLTAIGAEVDGDARSDVRQLLGLVESQDRDTFLPLDESEFDGNIAHRLLQYRRSLLPEVVKKLKADPRVSTDGLTWFNSHVAHGHSFRLNGCLVALQVNLDWWADMSDTPFWVEITDDRRHDPAIALALTGLVLPPAAGTGDRVLIPLRLPTGVPAGEVENRLVAQVLEIADRVNR